MISVDVPLAGKGYRIHIGNRLIDRCGELLPQSAGERFVVISNATVAALYLRPLIESLRHSGFAALSIIVADGEAYKSLESFSHIHTRLLELGADRSTTLIALGGGVVGDLAGFAAATFQRGVDYIQVPTTLLAQVDSSVGGKTGINHPLGKNMIGAFHQPRTVIADTATLSTLPAREVSAGLAEVIKYGLICDSEFFGWLEARLESIRTLDPATLAQCIKRCCEAKAKIVGADERESGERALLNLGHTFGHAIEAELGYGQWLHGEAVAAGIVLAARLSETIGLAPHPMTARIEGLFQRAGLPIRPPKVAPHAMLRHMMHDKKNQKGGIRLVLLRGIGSAVIESEVTAEQIRQFLASQP